MSRIKCRTPSTGSPINFTFSGITTAWTTLAEAPDFSVPDTSNVYPDRDPDDSGRAIRVGEIFFLTPVFARNKTDQDCWIEVKLLSENGVSIECPGRMVVPARDTALIPVQGRSLLKRVAENEFGDRLQVRAQTNYALDLWATAEEKPSSEHIGVV